MFRAKIKFWLCWCLVSHKSLTVRLKPGLKNKISEKLFSHCISERQKNIFSKAILGLLKVWSGERKPRAGKKNAVK